MRPAIGHGERLLALRRSPLVADVAAGDLAVMADLMNERELGPGEILLREGEPVSALHFVVEGGIEMSRGGQPLGTAMPGAFAGGLSFLARDASGFGAVASEPCACLTLDADDAEELFEDRFALIHHLTRAICARLVDVQRHLKQCGPPNRSEPPPPLVRELDFVERILILRRAAPFARASLNALAELSRSMHELRVPAGHELWTEGAVSGTLLMLVAGRVQCESPTTGYGFEAGPGAPLGALESVAERPRWFRARTLSPVVALQGHVEAMLDVFEDNHEMARDYLAFAAAWLLRALDVVGPSGWRAELIASAPSAAD